MKIFLANDDGFGTAGIVELENALIKGGHEVWVCAPESQRSACSHAISVHNPIEIKKVSERHYKCSGNPADCVLFFFRGGFPLGLSTQMPDVVISGINNGYNMSNDLLYSGTVGAATEGALFGVPSIAVSVADAPVNAFQDAAKFVSGNLEKFVPLIKRGCFLNINVPENSNGNWELSVPAMLEFYGHKVVEIAKDVYNFTGEANRGLTSDGLSDGSVGCKYPTDLDVAVKQNKIAVSAIRVIPEIDEEMQNAVGRLK